MTSTLTLTNARIWTGDGSRPRADRMTISGGRVVALDGETRGDAILDLEGRTVTPGLIDAHMHLSLGGETLRQLDLSAVTSRGQFEEAVARRHEALPAGAWLIGRGWSEQNWPSHELPDQTWLRQAGDRPAVCHRMDLHAVLVNEAVLRRIDTRVEPEGGRIARDAEGCPTGLLVEAAAWRLVNPLVPRPDAAGRRDAVRAAVAHVHAHGITAVGSMEYARELHGVFAPLRHELTLRCRLTLLDREWPLDVSAGRDFPGDDRLAVVGYKAFIDGTLGSRTARLLEDYADEPGNRGLLVELARDGHLTAWARAVAAAGLSPSMHAIGDEAARMALDAAEGLDASARPRIEHAQQIDPDDLPRFRGVIASMQPLHKADDGRYARQRLGESRMAGTFPFRRLLDAGARLAFGSDWPVVSCDPLEGIRAAVTGLTTDGAAFLPDQNLTVEEALRAYTAGAAHALGLAEAGVLRPGALADLVVLDGDPFAVNWASDRPRVMLTMVGGRVVYDPFELATAAGRCLGWVTS